MEPTNPAPNQPNPERPDTAPSVESMTPVSEPVSTSAPETTQTLLTTSPLATETSNEAASAELAPTAVPVVSAPAVASPEQPVAAASSVSPTPTTPNARSKKRWLLALVIVLVVLLAGGYVFGIYLPGRPGAVYSASLTNSGKAVDKLIDYTHEQSAANYKSASVNGTLDIKSSSGSIDVNMNGAFDLAGSGSLSADIDAMGTKVVANVRSVQVANSSSPDVYLQFTGIKPLLDSNGFKQLDNLDGQWIAIDHTLLETYTAGLTNGTSSATALPTTAQLQDALTKVQTVNKQYLFTTDKSKAVLTRETYLGKETKDGRSTYHYRVGYDKAHLQAYVSAVGSALDSSQLNGWAKKANDGKSLSQLLDLKSQQTSVAKAKSNYSFDLWADTKTRLIHSLQFSDPNGSGSTFTLAQNYTGGDSYPFSLTLNSKNSAGTTDTTNFGLTVDTKTHQYLGKLTAGVDGATYNLAFTVTPSDKPVTTTAPASSKSVTDILDELGLGSLDMSNMGGMSGTMNNSADTMSNMDGMFMLSQ